MISDFQGKTHLASEVTMHYELSITRAGRTATLVGPDLDKVSSYRGEDLESIFKIHLNRLSTASISGAIKKAICEVSGSRAVRSDIGDPRMQYGMSDPQTPGVRRRKVLVGLLPTLKFEASLARINWIVSARPTVTACPFELRRDSAKLWWTFEGVPDDPRPQNAPGDYQVSCFFKMTSNLEKVLMPVLQNAYKESFADLLELNQNTLSDRNEYIRIDMVDTADMSPNEFASAFRFGNYSIPEIEHPVSPRIEMARAGLHGFRRFIEATSGTTPDDDDIILFGPKDLNGKRALLYKKPRCPSKQEHITGVAWRVGGGLVSESLAGQDRHSEDTEREVRDFSASRPLSGMLANREASALDLT